MKKNVLMLAALAGLAGAAEAHEEMKDANAVQCFGVNSCKGTGKCGISKKQIELANKQFNNKFTKTKESHDCGGYNSCAGKGGSLAWVQEKNLAECHAKGGFTFKKGVDGQLVIEQGGAATPAAAAPEKKKG